MGFGAFRRGRYGPEPLRRGKLITGFYPLLSSASFRADINYDIKYRMGIESEEA